MKRGRIEYTVFLCSIIMLLYSCNSGKSSNSTEKIFSKRTPEETGITFNNSITEDESVNLITNEYAYMGGGVGIADFNNDGLQDIYFTANQTSSKLYINKGKNKFEDRTIAAGIGTNAWCTGVSVVDINSDGWQDVYVCVSGNAAAAKRKNLLFINQHNLTFTEEAAEYGLADSAYSVQAAFLDYDKDGDLDMYLVNNQIGADNPNNITAKNITGTSIRNDRLYKNNGINKQKNNPVYTDVSLQAGIREDGYGLGVSISDLNNDGWPDIYVTNDYISNDLLWLNNKGGSFKNVIAESLNHQSYSSMGVDVADMNNDGLFDIATLDMMPENNYRQKMMFSFLSYERYAMEQNAGYEPQFMRNMLHLNNGNLTINDTTLPRFSEIGQLAGFSKTDWSWSVLMADFDNDGWNDIHITNGMGKDLINADFVFYRADSKSANFNDPNKRGKALTQALNKYGSVPLQNYFYKNNKDLTFSKVTEAAGLNETSISNGAAYADFDNDGDLDLVVNNINQPAFFYENSQTVAAAPKHFLRFVLAGDSLNKNAFGTKVFLYANGEVHTAEQFPVRGYLSTVDSRLHFGLDTIAAVDSAVVIWPDNKKQVLLNVKTDTTIALQYSKVGLQWQQTIADGNTWFTSANNSTGINFIHKEILFNDFEFQRLLPQKFSQLGPFVSVADVNGDGLEDFFVGGAFNQSGQVHIQQTNGSFIAKDLVVGKKQEEDMGSTFFDADKDGDMDLMITGGSTEFDVNSPLYAPRLYSNDGKGNFSFQNGAIPISVNTSASCILPNDYDGDGDTDIFIGGRVSLDFPTIPKSFLLQNTDGYFSDVTATVAATLSNTGMITAAVWTDFNGDKKTDLIVAGEWMPLQFYKNENNKLIEVTNTTGLTDNEGMWRSLVAVDIDNDGDEDLIAGNLGMNNKYNADAAHPVKLFSQDVDANGSIDPVMAYYLPDSKGTRQLFPFISLLQLAEQVPSIKKKFLFNEDYAKASFSSIVNTQNSNTYTCSELRTCWFENTGAGKFVKHVLPVQAQFAPVNAICCFDINGDGQKDILLAGNEYQTEPITGRYDASYGCLLTGSKQKIFTAVSLQQSGFGVSGDVKDLKVIKNNSVSYVIAATNNAPIKIFQLNKRN
jgi:enediyne biosynthesis protein E4